MFLFTNGQLYDIQNYRPINQTLILARPVERIAKYQLVDLLTINESVGES